MKLFMRASGSGLLALLVAFAATGRAETSPRHANLQTLGMAAALYRRDHDGQWPAKVGDLYRSGYVPSVSVFVVPGAGPPPTGQLDERADYAVATADPSERPAKMVWEKKPGSDGKTLAFYSDRSIREIAPPPTVAEAKPPEVKEPAPPVVEERPAVVETASPPVAKPPAKPATTTSIWTTPETNTAPVNVEATVEQAHKLVETRRLKEALELYRRARQAQPNHSVANMGVASMELAVGDTRDAFEITRALLQQYPNSAAIHSLHGLAALLQNDLKTAQQMFARTRQLDPQLAQQHYTWAEAYNRQRVPEIALQNFMVAARIEPARFYTGHYYAGMIYELLAQPDRARAELEAYLRYDSTSQWAGEARRALQRLQAQPRRGEAPPGAGLPTN